MEKHWYKKWRGLLIIAFLGLSISIISAFVFYVFYIVNTPSETLKIDAKSYENKKEIEGLKNYWTGSNDPELVIVEFADFACHYCGASFSKIREISHKYRDRVKIIFRDFPVISEDSLALAMAGRCAGEQGLFWLMHDKLFINQGSFTIDKINNFGKQIGADEDRFNSCMNDNRYLSDIQRDLDAGRSLGITGTPTWFLNGQKVAGDIPYDILIQIIENN